MSINRERLTTLARRHLEAIEAQHALDRANEAKREAQSQTYLQPYEGAQTVIVPQGDRDVAVTMECPELADEFIYKVSEVVNG